MGEVGSYFNPFSALHDHTTQKFSELDLLSKVGIVLATVVTTPFFLVGGVATFRALTESAWNAKHSNDYGFPQQKTLENVSKFSMDFFEGAKGLTNRFQQQVLTAQESCESCLSMMDKAEGNSELMKTWAEKADDELNKLEEMVPKLKSDVEKFASRSTENASKVANLSKRIGLLEKKMQDYRNVIDEHYEHPIEEDIVVVDEKKVEQKKEETPRASPLKLFFQKSDHLRSVYFNVTKQKNSKHYTAGQALQDYNKVNDSYNTLKLFAEKEGSSVSKEDLQNAEQRFKEDREMYQKLIGEHKNLLSK